MGRADSGGGSAARWGEQPLQITLVSTGHFVGVFHLCKVIWNTADSAVLGKMSLIKECKADTFVLNLWTSELHKYMHKSIFLLNVKWASFEKLEIFSEFFCQICLSQSFHLRLTPWGSDQGTIFGLHVCTWFYTCHTLLLHLVLDKLPLCLWFKIRFRLCNARFYSWFHI